MKSFLLLLPFVSLYGADLVGTVRDAQGVIATANVTLSAPSQSTRQTLTDATGQYRFTGLPAGEYQFNVIRAGYESIQRKVSLGDQPVTLDVTLKPSGLATVLDVVDTTSNSALQLDSTATGGTLLNIPVRELPASISIISQQMMQERGVRTAIEAVEQSPGMIAGTSVGSIPSFTARGFSGNNITVMRDGIRQNTASQSARPLDVFLLDRVEVLKGPASILFGEGAIGAAVNYVTKEAQPRFLTDGILSYGSFNTLRTGFGINGPLHRRVHARADGSFYRTDGYMNDSAQNLGGVNTGLRYQIANSITLNLNGTWMQDFTESYYGTPLINGRIDPRTRFLNYNMRDNLAKSKNRFARATLDWQLNPSWHLRNYTFLATHTLDWRNFEGYAFNPTTQLVDVSSYFLIWRNDMLSGNRTDLQGNFRVFGRKVRTVSGFQYQNNDLQRGGLSDNTIRRSVDPFNPAPIIDPGRNYVRDRDVLIKTASFFTEAVMDITSRLKAIGGFRQERIALDYTLRATNVTSSKVFSPPTGRVGLLYNLNSLMNLYGSYTKAVEPVAQLVSLTGANQVFSLVPGRQIEFGSKGTFWAQKVDFTVAYFDLEKRDILTQTIVDGRQFAQQIGRQTARGVEISSLIRPTSRFTVSADASFSAPKFADFQEVVSGGIVSRTGNLPPNVPRRVVNVWANQRFGRFDVSGTVRFVGRRFADTPNLRPMENYTTLDAALNYRLERGGVLSFRGRNLGDALYATWSASGGTALRLEAPRSYDVTWTMRF
ncbi:MAG: TonB-dependent siderophore receptor [Acidobacteria bacterium]|nr:TonB-dependent siderophore receptor [Acidobacteriota bacterium]